MDKSKGLPGGRDNYIRMSVTLSKRTIRFLEQLRGMVLERTGRSIGKTEIIRATLQLLSELDIDPEHITDEESFYNAVKDALQKQ
jgi:hypothetical protein